MWAIRQHLVNHIQYQYKPHWCANAIVYQLNIFSLVWFVKTCGSLQSVIDVTCKQKHLFWNWWIGLTPLIDVIFTSLTTPLRICLEGSFVFHVDILDLGTQHRYYFDCYDIHLYYDMNNLIQKRCEAQGHASLIVWTSCSPLSWFHIPCGVWAMGVCVQGSFGHSTISGKQRGLGFPAG